MFNRQKPKHLSLIHIVNTLQKENIGDLDYLEEIKLDIEEDIPLSQKKVEYLKEEIRKLKEIKSQTKPKIDSSKAVEPKNSVKPKKEESPKKPRFGNIFGKKNKKTSENSEPQLTKPNSIKGQTDETDSSSGTLQSNVSDLIKHDSKLNRKTNGQKRDSFLKFLRAKKKPDKTAVKPAQNVVQDLSSHELDKNIDIDDSKVAASFVKLDNTENEVMTQSDYELPSAHVMRELEMDAEQAKIHNPNIESTYGFEKSHNNIKHVLDDLSKEKEMLRMDIEEAKQLDDIKHLLEELSKEKEQLKTNVNEIKLRYSIKPLVKKYDDIEQRLQSATDNLYYIQSDIYERIKELRFLRKDLSVIKEDLNSL